MKVYEWLVELDSHDIYDAAALAEDFRTKTGKEPCWPVYTHQQVRNQIEARGLGGSLGPDNGNGLANGWEIAESLAEAFAHSRSHLVYHGRGSRFRAALLALTQANL